MDESSLLSDAARADFESAIRRFEAAWQGPARPEIGAYLTVESPAFARLLIELVHVDLEYRLRAGEVAHVEEYLVNYPSLADDPEVLLGLVVAEYELTRRRDPELSLGHFIDRFPQFRGRLPGKIAAATVAYGGGYVGPQPGPLPTVDGYQLIGPLGSGGMGVVYSARQLSLGRTVALKFLPDECARDQFWLDRFRREAVTASGLNHPHICTIYDTGKAAGRPYLAMELVEGQTLAELAGHRPAIGEVVRLVRQAAQALAAAHAAGVVHRDIKPQNLMVRADGILKVLDFGLARRLPAVGGAESLPDTDPGTRIGTAMYMSPEQARGEPVGTASDVFSLGIVLYELTTGRHPFAAHPGADVLQAIVEHDPVSISVRLPEAPATLDALVRRMLAKDPRLRPAAGEVEAVLADAAAIPVDGTTGRCRPLTVGRDAELSALRRTFDAAAAGRGAVLCVTGEPGLGKTTLVETFLAELAAGGRPHVRAEGRCSERLSGTEAYLPFLEVLDNLIRGPDGPAAARLMKAVAPSWYLQVAPLAADDPAMIRILEEAKMASQERRKHEFAAFLQELSRHRPVVLFLDDVHWADPSSVDLLAYLGGRCADRRLFLILTYRPSDLLRSGHPFGSVKLELQARDLCREVALPFLTRDAFDRYLAVAFAGHRLPADVVHLLHVRTEGNPLFMVDLLRYLRDRGVIVSEAGGWVLARELPDLGRELPESVRGMVQRKVDRLDPADRRLLMAAGVQGSEFVSAVVAEVLGQEPAEVEERLDVLDRVHFMVRRLGEQPLPDRTPTVRYEFVHALYQDALHAALQPSRKAAWSAATARALEKHHGGQVTSLAARLAVLYEVARDHNRAAEYCRIAADNSARVFAHHEAVALARRGLKLLETQPNSADRSRRELPLRMTLGIQLQVVQGYAAPDAEQTYLRASVLCEQVQDGPSLFLVLWGLWMVYEVRSDLRKSRELGERLLILAEQARDPAQIIQAHMALAVTSFSLGELAATRDNTGKGIAIYDPVVHGGHAHLYGQDPRSASLAFRAVSLWLLGYPDQARWCSREAVALGEESGHPTTRTLSLYFSAMLGQYCRDAPAVRASADATTAIATEHGLSLWLANGQVMRGWALAELGEWAAGAEKIRQGLAAWSATGAETHHTYFLGLLADALGRGGRFEEGLAVLDEAVALSQASGTVFYAAEIYRLRGEFLLRRDGGGDHGAEGCFHQAIEIARRQEARSLELRAAISLARLGRRQGRAAQSMDRLTELVDWFTEGLESADLREARSLLGRSSDDQEWT